MAIQIPFPMPAKGYALNSKVRVNLDFIVAQFNAFNTGAATWDTVAVGIPGSVSGTLTLYNSTDVTPIYITPIVDGGVHGLRFSDTTENFQIRVGSTQAGIDYSHSPVLLSFRTENGSVATFTATEAKVNENFTVAPASGEATIKLLNPSNSTDYINLKTPAGLTGNYAFTFPATDGGANELLQTDGSGNTSWVAQVDISGKYDKAGGPIGGLITANGGLYLPHPQIVTFGDTGVKEAKLQAPTAFTNNYTWTLPLDQGGANQVLTNDGSGVLSWSAVSAIGGANTTLSNLTDTVAINKNLNDFSAGTITASLTGAASLNLLLTGGTLSGNLTLANAKELIFTEKLAGVDTISVRAPDSVTTSYALQLPPAVASAGQVLTDAAGNGVLSWATPTPEGATKALDNLASTAVNAHIIPNNDSDVSLGSTGKRWLFAYADDVVGTATTMADGFYAKSPNASKGNLLLKAADSAGDTNTTITNASQAGARTYTIPDAGAAANFVLSEGTATINGTKTFGSTITGSISGNAGTVTNGVYTNQSNQILGDYTLSLSGNDYSTQHTLLKLDARDSANDRAWRFIVGKTADSEWGDYSLRLSPYNTGNSGHFVLAAAAIRFGLGQAITADAATNFTEYMRVTSTAITQPLQPCFLAYNSTSDLNVTGDATTVTVEFDTEVFDQGADFNNTTDTFTAPITGRYLFSGHVMYAGINTTHEFGEVRLQTSNRTYRFLQSISTAATYEGFTFSVLADMDVNDTAYLDTYITNGDKVCDIVGGATATYISGSLIN